MQYLAERGYMDCFALAAEGLSGPGDDQLHALDDAVVDYQFRFEGDSDPGDEAIVLGITLLVRRARRARVRLRAERRPGARRDPAGPRPPPR